MSGKFKLISKVYLICAAFLISACGGNATPREVQSVAGSDKHLYEDALADIGVNNAAAIEKLDFLELNYPKSTVAPEAMVLKIHALYSIGKFDEAIIQADKFINLYPKNPSTPYTYYIKGMSNHGKMMDSQRDQQASQDAIDSFNALSNLFPNSEYTNDSKQFSNQAENMIAIKQIEIGRFYGRRGENAAAVQRYQEVLNRHPNTIAVPEAMYRLIEVHVNLNSKDNMYKYYKMLNTNYPRSIWAQRAVKFISSDDNMSNNNVHNTTYRTKALVMPGEETGFYSN